MLYIATQHLHQLVAGGFVLSWSGLSATVLCLLADATKQATNDEESEV